MNQPKSIVQHYQLASIEEEYFWLREKIQCLISEGVAAEEIAVLSPRHVYLESLVPYLLDRQIGVNYERRSDVLKQEPIQTLLLMARFVISLVESPEKPDESLLPQLLTHPMWSVYGLNTGDVWKLSGLASDQKISWIQAMEQLTEFQTVRKFLIFLFRAVQA
jgi:hypothetical protein